MCLDMPDFDFLKANRKAFLNLDKLSLKNYADLPRLNDVVR